jgi:short-subunit dehydrogenase
MGTNFLPETLAEDVDMTISLKPLREQVIVITGASSGIGLTTARMAASAGAKLVLAARNHAALERLEREINASGGQSCHVDADVGSEADVQRIVDTAVERFGGFDTWVNNAGVSVYGRLEEVAEDDHRRLFETNFWGVVYGSLAAVKHLKTRGGGVLINVGSTLSDRAIPLQGMYCASKHAVKGFTDALRMEAEEAGYPVSVTLIKPAAIDTPYTEHAKNYMATEPQNPSPVYAPETVARAILHSAQHPERDIFIGAAGKLFSVMEYFAPRLTDKYMEKMLFKQQQSDRPARHHNGDNDKGLHSAGNGLKERGGYEGHVAETSVYTQASLHPVFTAVALVAAGGLALAAILGVKQMRVERRGGMRSWAHRFAPR